MSKINVLDSLTANKIAAGEVVERPASVIKELVENALDAASTKIEISITRGGLDNITVIDNGEGMDSTDALLAFERHATSKIKSGEDLDFITTLGFRGEALPSIAAVSQVEIKTRPHSEISGTHIIIEGGKVVAESETGCPAGTSINVQNLFFNTPARLKNLKSPSIESGHISDVISRLAVAYPEVSFTLRHNNRVLISTPGTGDLLSIIASLYGTELARGLLPIKLQNNGIQIAGYISKPAFSRSNRNHQIFIINRRIVRNRSLSQALEEGYHSLLMTGRHPAAFFNLKVDPQTVDPNVHPAKMEVRLNLLDKIADMLTSRVKETLTGNNLIPDSKIRGSVKQVFSEKTDLNQKEFSKEDEIHSGNVDLSQDDNKEKGDIKNNSQPEQEYIQQSMTISNITKKNIQNNNTGTAIVNKENPVDLYNLKEETKDIQYGELKEAVVNEYPEEKNNNLPDFRPLGQIDNTYIVAQGDEGLYLIDQHAAHERILYEQNMGVRNDTYCQMLAVPQSLEVTHMEAQVIIKNILIFQELGFVLEHFGGDSFLLRGVPRGFKPGTENKIFLDILDYFFQKQHKLTDKELREKMLIMMSCKAAIKAGDRLTQGQIEILLEDLKKTELPYTCPHGRPTIIHISQYELEKMFKRVL